MQHQNLLSILIPEGKLFHVDTRIKKQMCDKLGTVGVRTNTKGILGSNYVGRLKDVISITGTFSLKYRDPDIFVHFGSENNYTSYLVDIPDNIINHIANK